MANCSALERVRVCPLQRIVASWGQRRVVMGCISEAGVVRRWGVSIRHAPSLCPLMFDRKFDIVSLLTCARRAAIFPPSASSPHGERRWPEQWPEQWPLLSIALPFFAAIVDSWVAMHGRGREYWDIVTSGGRGGRRAVAGLRARRCGRRVAGEWPESGRRVAGEWPESGRWSCCWWGELGGRDCRCCCQNVAVFAGILIVCAG